PAATCCSSISRRDLAHGLRFSIVSFAALRAVEENPGGEVVADAFEAVDLTGGSKYDVPRPELEPQVAVDALTAAAKYDVDLLARVGLLGVFASRREDLHREAPVLEEFGKRLAAGRGESRNCLGKGNLSRLHRPTPSSRIYFDWS